MRAVILHYHLKPGGVTRIIEHTSHALKSHGVEVLVVCGDDGGASYDFDVSVIPGIGYGQNVSSEDLADQLIKTAEGKLGGPVDLWHVHNHHLGKNPNVTKMVALLAERGERMLLHVHDFPEDYRGDQYRLLKSCIQDLDIMYPVGSCVHYGVLNRRDDSILEDAGVKEMTRHWLPNPVQLELHDPQDIKGRLGCDALYVYPTRAIRRKNIGEVLLLAALAPKGSLFGVTMAPKNPEARLVYDAWVAFADRVSLPVTFECCEAWDATFDDVIYSADAILTTSVAEGFGLAFLEPYAGGKSLVGRNLPEITADFCDAGIGFDNLYDRLDIPAHWVGEALLRENMKQGLGMLYDAYGLDMVDGAEAAVYESMVVEGLVDFGRLNESLQKKVIQKVIDDGLGEDLFQKYIRPVDERVADKNQAIVEDRYSLDAYGERIYKLYRDITAIVKSPAGYLSGKNVLERFLGAGRFILLRTQ